MDGLARFQHLVQLAADPEALKAPNPVHSYIPRPDDVIVAGPVKCGTTWMQQILHQIRTGGDENFSDIYDVSPYIPLIGQKSTCDLNEDHVAEPRIFKSHAHYDDIPKIEGVTRFVVIVRDPYDAQLSLIKFMFRYLGIDRDVTPKEYFEITSTMVS